METQKKILVSLTTWKTDWRKIISDLDEYGVTEIAFFPTSVDKEERKKIYKQLENSGVKSIPAVHLRQDFDREEYDYLVKTFDSKVFNIHPMPDFYNFLKENPDIANNIYLENGYSLEPIFFEMAEMCSGLCIDLPHYEDFGLMQNIKGYDKFGDLLRQKTIGMTHIGAILRKQYLNDDDRLVHESHKLYELSNLDYLKKHTGLFTEYNAIELTNSIEEQLEVKKYIENNILGAI